ncbi:methionine ABC transporter ATP-binding protein [Treponema sp.]|uniref:methionine ABC transporter ATP-binding protein n=1 Tax=Treponema sp. TaxID=166 RepID=UPI00388D835E
MQIKLENLKKTYISQNKNERSEIHAVDDVSLLIPENTIFGIIGKSGAGKSSLVRLVSLLETPDSGYVYYGDKRVDNLSKSDLILQRRKIGMIFQNFNLFSSRTAGKNIAYPLEIAGTPREKIKSRVREMLTLVGLSDRENAPVSTLSGGQKQRVAIARALATEPSILFCDEATSALDPNTTHQILELIKEIQKKMNLTVVMITHQMEVVRDACESVAVIENGRVVETGKVKEIFTKPKTQVTRNFIKNISSEPKNFEYQNKVVKWSKDSGRFVLHFADGATEKPVLSMMSKEFDVTFNILAAGLNRLQNEEVGYMEVDITGKDEEIEKVVHWLSENHVNVEKL